MEKDLEKCGCGSDCGCDGHNHEGHDHECGCGGQHDHEGCGCGEHESYVIDLQDENGNTIACPIVDQFKYEEDEYFLAQNPNEDSVYLFKLVGEELVVPEEDEFEIVSSYYQNELMGE